MRPESMVRRCCKRRRKPSATYDEVCGVDGCSGGKAGEEGEEEGEVDTHGDSVGGRVGCGFAVGARDNGETPLSRVLGYLYRI